MSGLRYAWYGDDFTGATDTLAVLAKAGLRTLLLLGVPGAERLAALGDLDALGIAGAARSMAPDAMRAELEPVGRFFAGLGVPMLHYKVCSTFDSAPQVGNIAVAAATLRRFFPNRFLPIVGGQPSLGRYCLFSTLFASAGAAGAVQRIDRHPTMQAHPVTPMAEADLRRHLAAQGLAGVAALHYPEYERAEAELDSRLKELVAAESGAVLLDVGFAAHLPVIGRLIERRSQQAPLLAVGASSVAQAMVARWKQAAPDRSLPAEPSVDPGLAPATGPVFVMAGSLSPVTRRQVEAAVSFETLPADAARLCQEAAYAEHLLETVAERLRQGRHVLVYTATAESDARDLALAPALAEATARFVAAIVRAVPLRRVGVLGGDTSSKAVAALGCWALSYVTTLAPGVTVCRSHGGSNRDGPHTDGLELMLKGGQMGSDDILERLL